MSFHVLIPARLASARLPNKPLADIGGAPMVVRVAQQALRSQAAQVVVAADSAAIADACAAHGIRAVLTDPDHPSGSDRLAQACALLGLDGDAMVVNVQGDEPLIDPALINAVAQVLAHTPQASMGTAAHPVHNLQDYQNPNVVKVVCNAQGLAHYFSRAPIPHARDHAGQAWWQGAAAQAAPSAMKPRVERPNGTARVMESSFVLAASVFPGLWVCFARADTAVTQATKVAGQHGSGR